MLLNLRIREVRWGEHFKSLRDGLKGTKDKLDGLAKEIASTPHADTKEVESVINSTSEVISKLIASLTNLAGVVKEDAPIGDAATAGAAVAAEEASVKAIIEEVKAIIETATNSGVKIEKGNAGNSVENGNGPKAVVHNARASAGDATKLADEVAKADPWAMIDKIKNAKTKTTAPAAGDDAGQLATASAAAANDNGTASTNADLAAAVALKAMTKGGKFSQPANNEDGALKAAAASAVNKVLGILDVIIRKAVNLELGKIREAVKEIKYFEISGTNTSEAGTIQPAVK
ncbi:variable large family protein [Borrelia persica]|uniref:variable large family protein n=1 Tax=Borrelia persica TaxID=44448 RepID=UPI001F305D30|nr:variable large family protein [Borrelia persica]